VLAVAAARAQSDEPPLDPLQRAVVDSLASAPRTTPAELLEATVRAADIGATAVALEWFRRLATVLDEAGDRRGDMLADLGDSPDAEGLGRVERALGADDPTVAPVIRAIRSAARERRRDPARLAEAAAALDSPRAADRQAATERLVAGHIDSLAILVPLLQSTDPAEAGPRDAARQIVAMLGDDAREPLMSWLGSGDVEHWPGIIEALDASGASDIDAFLVAPALVEDVPAAAATTAREVLERRAARRAGTDRPFSAVPDRDTAERLLTDRLDRILSPEGLPGPDCLSLEPIREAAKAADAFGGSVTGVVERIVWDDRERRFRRVPMSPRWARAMEAAHVARDLAALGPRDPRSVELVLLATLERMLVDRGDPLGIPPADLRKAITQDGTASAPLVPGVRKALVRALEVPDPAVQFAAARTLALAAGSPPFAGASRVLDVLVHASTARGVDRAVVGHPDSAVVDSLATGVSRFDYEPVRVSTGREAVFAARANVDTVLVMIAARIATPSAFETTQFLQQQPVGGLPTVLVVVDPLDDDGRGRFLSRLIQRFSDLHGVALVDRLDSFFVPVVDERTGRVTMPARFPDAIAQASGPGAVDPATRSAARMARLGRAHEALRLLADMSTRGWDVRPATASALDALSVTELYDPAVRLLGGLGRPEAQAALAAEAERPDLPENLRKNAVNAFAASVEGHGLLLDCGHVRSVAARYNPERPSSESPDGVLDVLESAGSVHRPVPRNAPLPRSTP